MSFAGHSCLPQNWQVEAPGNLSWRSRATIAIDGFLQRRGKRRTRYELSSRRTRMFTMEAPPNLNLKEFLPEYRDNQRTVGVRRRAGAALPKFRSQFSSPKPPCRSPVLHSGPSEPFPVKRLAGYGRCEQYWGRACSGNAPQAQIQDWGAFVCVRGEGYEFVQNGTKRPRHSNRTRINCCGGGSCCHRQLL